MYKIVSFPDIHLRFTILSFSSTSLPLASHPRNKDVCQADIITIFANICYRPISMLSLLPFSFCMYELVLISPRKVNAWINVSELNRAERMKHMYGRACAVFVHSGTVLSARGGGGRGVEAMSSLTEKGRAARGRVGDTLHARCHSLPWKLGVEGGRLWGCDACLLCCHIGLRGKDWQTAAPSSQRPTGAKQEEGEDGGQRTRRHQEPGAKDLKTVRLVPRVRSCSQSEMSSENAACPSWEENWGEGVGTFRSHFWKLLLKGRCVCCNCLSSCSHSSRKQPLQKLDMQAKFVPVLLRVGGQLLTCWLACGHLAWSSLQPCVCSSMPAPAEGTVPSLSSFASPVHPLVKTAAHC